MARDVDVGRFWHDHVEQLNAQLEVRFSGSDDVGDDALPPHRVARDFQSLQNCLTRVAGDVVFAVGAA